MADWLRRLWNSLSYRSLQLVAVPLLLFSSVVAAAEQPVWRRTAHGWERAEQWHIAATRSRIHPATVGALEALLGAMVLLALPRQNHRGSREES